MVVGGIAKFFCNGYNIYVVSLCICGGTAVVIALWWLNEVVVEA